MGKNQDKASLLTTPTSQRETTAFSSAHISGEGSLLQSTALTSFFRTNSSDYLSNESHRLHDSLMLTYPSAYDWNPTCAL
jgi:hypothetical protein